MRKILIGFLILFVSMLSAPHGDALELGIAGDRLSLEAEGVPLQDVLERFAGLGIRVHVDPGLNPAISVSFRDRDLQKGLETILRPYGHVLIWDAVKGPGGPIHVLKEIQVFEPGRKDLMKPLLTGTRLSVAENPADGSLFVKGEILIRLKAGVKPEGLRRLLRQINGTVVEGHDGLGIYRVRVPEEADIPSLLEEIGDHPGLEKAEPNYAYPVSSPLQIAPQGGSVPGPDGVPSREGKAPVAVLDTGLNPEIDLKGLVVASMDALNPEQPISDALGHGTQMALIASGTVKPEGVGTAVETRTPVISVKAFDDGGVTSNLTIMKGIDFALKNGARVMSLSWGSETRSGFLEDALGYAASNGLVIVASAGNEPTGKAVYPAAYPGVIAVGALGPEGKTWDRSNYGDFITLYAPGFATLPVGHKGDPGTYAGTSIAAAFTANLIANFISGHPDATVKEILEALGGLPSRSEKNLEDGDK